MMESNIQTELEERKKELSKIEDLQLQEVISRRSKLKEFVELSEIESAGFVGFKTIEELSEDTSAIHRVNGVYLVLNLGGTHPTFLEHGAGGFFKLKNPNVSIEELNDNWVDDTIVLYIGKAGGSDSRATLKSRIGQYLKFGQGKNIGHYGGRYIWQLQNSKDLVICWKPLVIEEPRALESDLIKAFVAKYRKRPFANLMG